MFDYLYRLEVDGKLSRKQHQEEKAVEDHKWLQILLLSEKFHNPFYKPNTFRITFDILENLKHFLVVICITATKLLQSLVRTFLLPNMSVLVGRVPVEREADDHEDGGWDAGGSSKVPWNDAAHHIYGKHSYCGDRYS